MKLSLKKICSISSQVIRERQISASLEGGNALEEPGKIRDLTMSLIRQKENERNDLSYIFGRVITSVVFIVGVFTIPLFIDLLVDEIKFRQKIASLKEQMGPTELEKLAEDIFADRSPEIKVLKAAAKSQWTAESFERSLNMDLNNKKTLKDDEITEEQKRYFSERNPDTSPVMVQQFYKDVVQRDTSFRIFDRGVQTDPDAVNLELNDAVYLLNAAKNHLKQMKAEEDPEEIKKAQKELDLAQSRFRKAEAAKVMHHVNVIDEVAAGDEKWQFALQALCTQSNMNDLFGVEVLQMQMLHDPSSQIGQKIEAFKEQHGIAADFKISPELATPKITLQVQRDAANKIKKVHVVCEGHLNIITSNNEGKLASLLEGSVAKKLSYTVTLSDDGEIQISNYHKGVL